MHLLTFNVQTLERRSESALTGQLYETPATDGELVRGTTPGMTLTFISVFPLRFSRVSVNILLLNIDARLQ